MAKSTEKLAQSKIIILYLLHKINLPVSASHIQEFALSAEYMDYFSLSTYLAEMTSSGHLFTTKEDNQTCYILSEEGKQVLAYFKHLISDEIKSNIMEFVKKKHKEIRREFEVAAKYYASDTQNYTVKCGVYDGEETLMEINLSVISQEYAKLICDNWKENVNTLYLKMLKDLIGDVPNEINEKIKKDLENI